MLIRPDFRQSIYAFQAAYSGLNLNQDKAESRRQYKSYGKASQRSIGSNLIHYKIKNHHLRTL